MKKILTAAATIVAGAILSGSLASAADSLKSFPVELVIDGKKSDADWKLISEKRNHKASPHLRSVSASEG